MVSNAIKQENACSMRQKMQFSKLKNFLLLSDGVILSLYRNEFVSCWLNDRFTKFVC